MKYLHFLVMVSIVSLSAVFFVAYQNRDDIQRTFDAQVSDLHEAQWVFLEGKIEGWYQQSKEHLDAISSKIRHDIITAYKTNGRNLEYDLTHPNQNDNPVINIIGKYINGVHLNGVLSDADDAWAANRDGIISDFSKDCSAQGRTRTFEKEEAAHFSPLLAKQNIESILNEDTTSHWLGWEYLTPRNPKWTVQYFSKESLKALFMEYGLDSLSAFEFSTPDYIDFNSDLAGVPIVNDHGMKNKNGQLIIVQGFNVYRQLYATPDGMAEYRLLEDKIGLAKERADKLMLLDTFELVVSFLAIFAVWIAGVKKEKQEQEGRCNE